MLMDLPQHVQLLGSYYADGTANAESLTSQSPHDALSSSSAACWILKPSHAGAAKPRGGS